MGSFTFLFPGCIKHISWPVKWISGIISQRRFSASSLWLHWAERGSLSLEHQFYTCANFRTLEKLHINLRFFVSSAVFSKANCPSKKKSHSRERRITLSLLSITNKDAQISVTCWKQKLLIVSEQMLLSIFLKDMLILHEFEGGIRPFPDKKPMLYITEYTFLENGNVHTIPYDICHPSRWVIL